MISIAAALRTSAESTHSPSSRAKSRPTQSIRNMDAEIGVDPDQAAHCLPATRIVARVRQAVRLAPRRRSDSHRGRAVKLASVLLGGPQELKRVLLLGSEPNGFVGHQAVDFGRVEPEFSQDG